MNIFYICMSVLFWMVIYFIIGGITVTLTSNENDPAEQLAICIFIWPIMLFFLFGWIIGAIPMRVINKIKERFKK